MDTLTASVGKVLLVDDEEDIAKIFAGQIAKNGFEVSLAGSGDEALRLLRDHDFDLVLSDIAMPGMSGLKLLSRSHALGMTLPFVFITGYGNSETIIEAVRLGAVDFLCKPCSKDELISVVQRAYAISRRQRAINDLIQQLAEGGAPRTGEFVDDLRRQIAMLRVMGSEDIKTRRSAG